MKISTMRHALFAGKCIPGAAAQRWLLGVVLLLGVVMLVPWRPDLFNATLDGSWRAISNEAFIAGLQFGRDIVFTVGPYGFLYWSMYHPETYPLVVLSWSFFSLLYLWAAWRISCQLIMPFSARIAWLLGVVMLGALDRDNVVLNGILILTLIHYFQDDDRSIGMFGVVLMAGLAWVSLIKFTFFVVGALVVAVIAADQLILRRRVPWYAVVYVVGLVCGWLLAGQSLAGFPRFVVNSLEISSGYVDAMSISAGPAREVLLFLVVSGWFYLLVAEAGWRRYRWQSFLPLVALGGILYMTFKHGFVRHDEHPIIAALGLVFLVLAYGIALWPAMQGFMRRALWAGLFASVLIMATGLFTRHTGTGLAGTAIQKCFVALPSQGQACIQALTGSTGLPQAHAARSTEIRTDHPLPAIDGTVDLYPFQQGVLMAYGLTYCPRPVIQSYSAYSAPLATINMNHLRGESRPRTILFDIKTIDQRFPSLDDGLSWPDLLTRYDLSEITEGFLVLTNASHTRTASFKVLNTVKAGFNEPISVPPLADAPVWTVIDVRPTFFGRVMAFLFKPAPVYLDVTMRNGVEHQYRFLPRVAGAGFLLSPVVADRNDFVALTVVGGLRSLEDSAVTSIKIRTAGALWRSVERRYYNKEISVSFHELQYPKPLQLQTR